MAGEKAEGEAAVGAALLVMKVMKVMEVMDAGAF